MTLRDFGAWFSEKWNATVDGFRIAATHSFWDWPLWLSIPVGVGFPIAALWFFREMLREARYGKPDPLYLTIGYATASLLCVLAAYDLWVSKAIFSSDDNNAIWLRIAYPIMLAFFGMAFLVSLVKRLRQG